jgi:hypothetical protein
MGKGMGTNWFSYYLLLTTHHQPKTSHPMVGELNTKMFENRGMIFKRGILN